MPANLTPQYHEAEERFKKATAHDDKLAALQEMLRVIPKHKGTEKLQADLKRRLAKLRRQPKNKSGAASHKPFHHVEREGAGQVVLCGPPNGGKSSLLDRLTHAEPEVADYPFTTRAPLAGMMPFEDIQIQLVDTPPLAAEVLEPWQMAMIAQADAAVLLFDVNDPLLLEQTDFVLKLFAERDIALSESGRPKVLTLGSKVDAPGGRENFEAWRELYEEKFQPQPFSSRSDENLDCFRRTLFKLLDVVRVYTKKPGESPEQASDPFVLTRGSTALDAAAAVHRDLTENFKFAKVWGKTLFDGQMVERAHVMEDGDVIEIHL